MAKFAVNGEGAQGHHQCWAGGETAMAEHPSSHTDCRRCCRCCSCCSGGGEAEQQQELVSMLLMPLMAGAASGGAGGLTLPAFSPPAAAPTAAAGACGSSGSSTRVLPDCSCCCCCGRCCTAPICCAAAACTSAAATTGAPGGLTVLPRSSRVCRLRISVAFLKSRPPSKPGSLGEVGATLRASSSRIGVGLWVPAASRCRLPLCTEGWPPPPPACCMLGVRDSLRGVHCMGCGEEPGSPPEPSTDTVCRLPEEAAGRAGGGSALPPVSRCMPCRSHAISCSTRVVEQGRRD